MIDKIKKLLEPEASLSAKLIGISLFFGKVFERHDSRLIDLEARQLEKGEKGDKGELGEKGEKGERGPKGDIGLTGKQGPKGDNGKDGKAGKHGKDGISVVDSEIAMDGHLVLKLSSGKIIDAGPLPEAKQDIQAIISKQLSNNQITVSSVAPANPSVNDLWLDIS